MLSMLEDISYNNEEEDIDDKGYFIYWVTRLERERERGIWYSNIPSKRNARKGKKANAPNKK